MVHEDAHRARHQVAARKLRSAATSRTPRSFISLILLICCLLTSKVLSPLSNHPALIEIQELASIVDAPSRSPRIAYITFSHLSSFAPFQYLILPSTKLWLPSDASYFVVLSMNWKAKYRQLCDEPPHFVPKTFCSQIQPIFVDCPDEHWGFSPCCKQEQGLIKMYETYGQSFDWFLYSDDDNYFRVSLLEGLLKRLDSSIPMIATSGAVQSETSALGKSGYYYHPKDLPPYNCSRDENRIYPWGQPVLYSQAALQKIQHGLSLKGLTKECEAFDVTHDTGNAIFHYMHSLPEVRFGMAQRQFWRYNLTRWSKDEMMGFHGIKVTDHAGGYMGKKLTMQEVHETFKGMNQSVPEIVYHRPTGFTETPTYRQFGDISTWAEWHTFTPEECG